MSTLVLVNIPGQQFSMRTIWQTRFVSTQDIVVWACDLADHACIHLEIWQGKLGLEEETFMKPNLGMLGHIMDVR